MKNAKPNGNQEVNVECGHCGSRFTAKVVLEKTWKRNFITRVRCPKCGKTTVFKF